MREYTVTGENITIGTGLSPTLVLINPVAGTAIEIIRCWSSQMGSTTSAQQGIQIGVKASAFGTYVSVTPAKTKSGDPASGITGGTSGAAGTCGVNASAEGAGTVTIIYPDAFNVLNGWLWIPTPNETIIVRAADSLAFQLKMTTIPGSLTSWNFGVTYRELG